LDPRFKIDWCSEPTNFKKLAESWIFTNANLLATNLIPDVGELILENATEEEPEVFEEPPEKQIKLDFFQKHKANRKIRPPSDEEKEEIYNELK